MSNPELQALLANLRPRSQAPSSTNTPQPGPSTPFQTDSALPSSPPPPFSPTPQSSNAVPSNATAQNLLNLLNFNYPPSQATSTTAPRAPSFSGSQTSTARKAEDSTTVTATDFLARAASSQSRSSAPQTGTDSDAIATQPNTANDQEIPNTASSEIAPTSVTSTATGQDTQKPLFTYKNPFEALRASRPHTPRASQPAAEPVDPQMHMPESKSEQEERDEEKNHDRNGEDVVQSVEDPAAQQLLNSAMPDRVKLTPTSRVSPGATPARSQTTGEISQTEASAATLPPGESNAEPFPDYKQEAASLDNSKDMHETHAGNAPENGAEPRVVPVLSFPVKAFVSITLQLKGPAASKVRQEAVMEISRLKKEFDQIDRSLASASAKFITYALVKNGGMRIIRQEDGKDRHIFKHTHDRIFNVAICTTSLTNPPSDYQAVLGTGVSGAVYYATLSKPDQDLFHSNQLDTESLILPPYPAGDENTAGGVLKTRAKRSSRHPEFFAVGRGKSIHLLWPSTILSSRYGVTDENRVVNMEKLFQERSLQILTGKAGKDFTFSEDDTMIVSLDKTGRLRFWDIRKLIDEENARSMQITPYVIDAPVLSLATASPAEKSWPTSVLFLDKARPYVKGGALRYVLVGLRQNHTLQLWDIALGKAVQEINFPHENETDGICSVAYHPASGIIVVGHPTRNSIFFIHLSAPRYGLSSTLTQASYVQRVAAKDPDIPKPESTACMSGIREISFEDRGHLRSVELLPLYKDTDNAQADSEDALFELYVAHSTGVTCLVISKVDLGWDSENKIINNINAEQEGLVVLKELKLGSVIEESTRSKSPALEATGSGKVKKKKDKKQKDATEEVADGLQERELDPAQPASTEVTSAEQAAPKESKKKKKAKDVAEPGQKKVTDKKADLSLPLPEATGLSPHQASLSPNIQGEHLSMSISGDWLDKELKKIEKGVAHEFKRELETLYQNIKTDRASQDQASASRQEAVLRVVSQTLNTNVESSLTNILRKQMEDVVVPSLLQSVSTSLSQQITQAVSQTVKKELGSELPTQVDRTLQSPQMLTRIADNISARLTGSVQHEIVKAINTSVAASMKSIATTTAKEVVVAAETRMTDQIVQMQRQHASFNDKIEQLNHALQSVAQTLQSMSQAQVAFQSQVLQDRRAQAAENSRPSSAQHPGPTSFVASPASTTRGAPAVQPQRQKTKAELELEEIASLMSQRNYEEASIKWLQSSQPVKLFDDLFSRYTPDYLATDVSPLVAFSIGVTVGNSLSTNIEQRLEWMGTAFDTIDFKDRETIELAQHAPQLLSVLIQKLDNLYVQQSQSEPYANVTKMIPALVLKARQLMAAFQAVREGRDPTVGYVSGGRSVID